MLERTSYSVGHYGPKRAGEILGPNHDGRVVLWGTSYSGWLNVMRMIDAHLALRASMVQAPLAEMWIEDDFHHNGVFR